MMKMQFFRKFIISCLGILLVLTGCELVEPTLPTLLGEWPINERAISMAISPDKGLTAVTLKHGVIEIWDTTTQQRLQTLEGHTEDVIDVDFSPDGETLVSGSADKTVRLWRLSDGELLDTLEGHTALVSSVEFAPDGENVVSASLDTQVIVWDISQGEALQTFDHHPYQVKDVAYSPDGQIIASVAGPLLYLWQPESGLLGTAEGHTGPIWSVDFSNDGQMIATAGADRTVHLWNTTDGALLNKLDATGSNLAFIPNTPVVMVNNGVRVQFWNTNTATKIDELNFNGRNTVAMSISLDGKQFSTLNRDHEIQLWQNPEIFFSF